ncbi:hemerythrin domain-containing protein [Prauserella cavernicola]|uniref:Hemerythrin domain-containing protein n=1 Tax=Prauserella cavernicola TaxID=2800127 RepID=A0A934QV98_9PSEU|nr:hemerythrin domain-containing protein [Prauserella cavernicola]MBK1786991.1 hemerythrin domain-containing protein [Prauserella cavernicola]
MTTSFSGTRDLIDLIRDAHTETERRFSQLRDANLDQHSRKKLTDRVIADLVRHSVGEQQVVYPAARRFVDDGDAIAEREIGEHAEAERVMKRLEDLDAASPEFDRLVEQLIASVRRHIEDQETHLLPALRDACGDDELVQLGHRMARAKQTAPTRPRPGNPDRSPANQIVDRGAGLIDRVRDKVGKHRR